MIDDYEIRESNKRAAGLVDTRAALLLLARVTERAIHLPANGTRVIIGWADTDTGKKWLTDDPVLWFDADGDPVTPTADLADPIRNAGENSRWCMYHPDSSLIGDEGFSPRDSAIGQVNDALDRYLAAGDVT